MLKESNNILVVDSESVVRDFITYALQTVGYNVLTAADGQQALQLLSSDVDIDLIITDMGISHNGVRLVQTLREELNLPFIMMSGEHPETLAEACMRWEGSSYLAKPFYGAELRTTIKRVSILN